MISIVSQERGWSITNSIEYVQALHDQAVARFIEVKNNIVPTTNVELDQCVEVIEIDVTGNTEGMIRLKKRYF